MAATERLSAVEVHSRQAEDFAASYQALEQDPYHSCFTYSRMRLGQALEQLLPQSGSGLNAIDVGCGTGHHLGALSNRGFEVVGVDGSGEMLDQARDLQPALEFHQADVTALPFSDGSFDLVLCVEVLRYLPDPRACIAEMARVLRPGGTCLATAAPLFSINGYAVVNRLAAAGMGGGFVRLKQYFTTPSRMLLQFEHAGFSPVEVHGVYAGPLNWVEHLAPRRLPSLLRRWEPIDRRVADRPALRGLSNMLLARAVRAS